MKLLPILLASVYCCSFSAFAQKSDTVEIEDEKPSSSDRTCRLVFPERPNDAPKFAYLFDGRKSRRINLPSMNFSEVIALPRGEITLLLTSTKITELENFPLGAPRLNLTEDIKDFYILLSPDPSNKVLPLRLNLVNTSDGKLKSGETLWFNFTDHRIVAKLGESKLSVTPKSTTITKGPQADSGYYTAQFAYQPNATGQFQKITEQHWWHDAKNRHVGFIVNTGGRLPKIYYFRDFRQ